MSGAGFDRAAKIIDNAVLAPDAPSGAQVCLGDVQSGTHGFRIFKPRGV